MKCGNDQVWSDSEYFLKVELAGLDWMSRMKEIEKSRMNPRMLSNWEITAIYKIKKMGEEPL